MILYISLNLCLSFIYVTLHANNLEDAKHLLLLSKPEIIHQKNLKTSAKLVILRANFSRKYSFMPLRVCLYELCPYSHFDFCPFFKASETVPAPSSFYRIRSTGVQQSVSPATDSQLYQGLGFDRANPTHLDCSL